MHNRLVLALDNSLDFLNIALAHEENLLEERHIKPHKPPSQSIPGEVLQVLANYDYHVEDLSLIIVTLGPGSFTGIRVGLAFCKGLASGRKIPLIGVSTLDLLAFPFSFLEGHYLCPLLDAKKGEVFTSLYRVSHGNIERLSDYQALKPAEVPHTLKTPCLCFGTGVRICQDFLSSIDGVQLMSKGFSRISGETLIKVGLQRVSQEKHLDLRPIYGRRSDAEIKFGVKVI
jgi:tRNA threonylcarbamoyladenosine biosynthesis protein TsaB